MVWLVLTHDSIILWQGKATAVLNEDMESSSAAMLANVVVPDEH